jgi:hypothetical protein
MTRTLLATATILVAAATFSSAANACISCEHVPVVVRSSSTLPHTGHYYAAKPHAKRQGGAVSIKSRVAKAPVVEKSAKAPKVAKVAKPEPVKVAKTEPVAKVEKKVEKVAAKAIESENSSVTLASVADTADVAKPATEDKQATAKSTDCKKFFASVGMTLTVPCE